MPHRDRAPAGAPCWVDLMSSDTDRSRAFYQDLFGWTPGEPAPEFGGYFNFSKDGAPVAGCMASQPGGPSDVWSVYLATDDAARTAKAASEAGGQVMVEPMAVHDLGTMAIVADPSGAVIGTWQPGTFPGLTVVGEYDTPSWFELHTRGYDAAVGFYRSVFGWDTKTMGDTPEFRYTTQVDGDEMLAGVMDAGGFLPDGVPSHWLVYFGVPDADAALAKIVELGGSVVVPAEDTPYGRLATAADPNGAVFRLVAPNEAMPARS